MASPFAGFSKNFQTKYKIGADKETLFPIGGGIKTAETDFDEDSDDVAYYDLNGGTESISSSQTFPFNFEGNRKYGDQAQDFVRSKMTSNDKSCYLEVTEPDGSVLSGPATMSKITPFGGDANDRSDYKFTVTFTGTPTDTKATADETPVSNTTPDSSSAAK